MIKEQPTINNVNINVFDEHWELIDESGGSYLISDRGRVLSKDKYVNGRNNKKCLKRGKILRNAICSTMYPGVMISDRIDRKKHLIHRLMAKAFIPNPLNKRTVNHKNGIKTDNRIENLEWATYSENLLHAIDTGLKGPTPHGKEHHRSKKVFQYSRSGILIAEYSWQHEAAILTGIAQTNISSVCLGKRKTAGGFIWKFKK